MRLPDKYAWLGAEPGPLIMRQAVALYGTIEYPGPKSNPVIMDWAQELGLKVYSSDAIPWCGLFVAICAKRATWDLPDSPLWARDWLNWGTKEKTPMLGDVMVFARGSGGHVAFYVGEDKYAWHILGGNQSDQVNIVRKTKDKSFLGARRCPWRYAQPSNVRKIVLSSSGTPLAGSEA